MFWHLSTHQKTIPGNAIKHMQQKNYTAELPPSESNKSKAK